MAEKLKDGLSIKTLEDMSKDELKELAKALSVEIGSTDTNGTILSKIKESGKYKLSGKESGGGQIVKDGKRTHKKLGEYKRCVVHPTEHSQQGTSIFCSIGLYTVEFQPRTEIDLPIKVIKFLKTATVAKHKYDKTKISENGQVGAHITEQVPKYVIELVEVED